jgi:AcrR family transcriptional regulator
VLARGVGKTSLDDIGDVAGTGRSQLFHYFPGGKHELVAAIAQLQSERVLDAQRPHIDQLDSWAAWRAWHGAVLAHYRSQPHLTCPISALANELLGHDPDHAEAVARFMLDWQALLEHGVRRMIANGHLAADTDPRHVALMMFAALQGGLVLMQTRQSLEPLRAGLDAALTVLRAHAADQPNPIS